MARMLWGAWCCGVRGVGVGSGQRPALRLRAAPRTRRRPGAAMPWAVGAAAPLAPRCVSVLQGAGAFTVRLLGRRMAPLRCCRCPLRPDGVRGAGVAGARVVWWRRRDGKIRAPCMIRGVSAAKRGPPWQDLRDMHSRKAVCGAFRIHGAHILPTPAHFGYTAAICCQEGALFPSEAPSGMHEAKNLPRMAARERISRISCHCQSPGDAPRQGVRERIAREYCHGWPPGGRIAVKCCQQVGLSSSVC